MENNGSHNSVHGHNAPHCQEIQSVLPRQYILQSNAYAHIEGKHIGCPACISVDGIYTHSYGSALVAPCTFCTFALVWHKMQHLLCKSARSAKCKRCKVVVLLLYFLIIALLVFDDKVSLTEVFEHIHDSTSCKTEIRSSLYCFSSYELVSQRVKYLFLHRVGSLG